MFKKPILRSVDDLKSEHDKIEIHAPKINIDEKGYFIPDSYEKLKQFHPEVVLFRPQIPQNTGTIARMCAAFCCRLHLVGPLGFEITEKGLKRAGLDYWDYVDVYLHNSWEDFLNVRGHRRLIFIETGGQHAPCDFKFNPGDMLVFGAETFGIPHEILKQKYAQESFVLTLPMYEKHVRSINLSNTVSIVTYTSISSLNK